jgi:phytoene dehydrogenase-like protein
MGSISNAIASAARSAGVEIRTNCSVDQIDIRQSKAEGVILNTGEEIKGKCIVSNATAYVTFKQLISNDCFDNNHRLNQLRKHILNMDYTSGTTKINLALNGLP